MNLEDRMTRLEEAMNVLRQDWLDTQALIPTKREVQKLDAHLTRQDWVLTCILVGLVTGLIVAFVVH